MSADSWRNPRHSVSDIDIQLWAREQRRLWFARTFSAPLRALVQAAAQAALRVLPRLASGAAATSHLDAFERRSAGR